MNKIILIVYGFIWFSVSMAIICALYITHDIKCLWFLLIPALIRIKTGEDGDEE